VVIPFFEYADYNFVAKTKFGGRIAGNNLDIIQRYIYYFGVWEQNLSCFLNERLKEGDAFIDIGANIGYFTLQAAKLVGPSGKVIAIEVSPTIFKKLIANLQRNRVTNVETYNRSLA